jgi:TPR repeat protein
MRATRPYWSVGAVLLLAAAGAVRADPPPQNYALLVGIRQYDKGELESLRFTEADVVELASTLRDGGYPADNIVLLTNSRGTLDPQFAPTAANIRSQLRSVLGRCQKGDSVLVALAGHGVQFKADKEDYFCPTDAKLGDKSTLLTHAEVYGALENCPAAFKVLLIDACRNEVARASRSPEVESVTRPHQSRPPGGVAAFYSCSAKERAYESPELRHGVFFHFVIKGLAGEADLNGDKRVTLPELELYVKERTGQFVKKEFGAEQEPDLDNRTRGLVPILRWDRPPQPRVGTPCRSAREVPGRRWRPEEAPLPFIDYVVPDSPAEKAGLRKGDLVRSVNGQPLRGIPHYFEIIDTHRPGSVLQLEVLRDGKPIGLTLTLGSQLREAEAARLYLRAAEGGDTTAQKMLARFYKSGEGVPLDVAESLKWCRRSAEGGDAEAQFELAEDLGRGLGGPADPTEVLRWYRAAAAGGNGAAMRELGWRYFEGKGVEKDKPEGVRWLRKAAEAGDTNAQQALVVWSLAGPQHLFVGAPAPQDEGVAARWFLRVLEQACQAPRGEKFAPANDRLRYADACLQAGEREQAAAAYRTAAEALSQFLRDEPYHLPARLALADTHRNLAKLSEEAKDDAAAVREYRQASDLGLGYASLRLAQLLAEGRGAAKDEAAAARLRKKAEGQQVYRLVMPSTIDGTPGRQDLDVLVTDDAGAADLLANEEKRLRADWKATLPPGVRETFARIERQQKKKGERGALTAVNLYKIARENNVSFDDLADYAVGKEEKKEK